MQLTQALDSECFTGVKNVSALHADLVALLRNEGDLWRRAAMI
jgi:hypothetical protein